MANSIFRKIETAGRALESLFGVLESRQAIEIAYRGGMGAGRTTFSLQVRGRTEGSTAREAADNALRLRQNLSLALGAQPGLRFGGGTPQSAADGTSRPRWVGRVHPEGVLVSTRPALRSMPLDGPPLAALFSPVVETWDSGLSLVDTVLASPQNIEVVVTVKPCRPNEEAKQGLRHILQAMDMGKAAYLMLPDRRQASAEECEFLAEALRQQIKRWLIHPFGIELGCAIHSTERPSEALLAMVGKALFPNQVLALSIEPSGAEASPVPSYDAESATLDLRLCLNAGVGFPTG